MTRGGPRGVSDDLLTTALESGAVLLLAVGAALVLAGLVGGLVGAGVGLGGAALVLTVSSAVLRVLTRPERLPRPTAARRSR